jgi:anti-anti-sigma regulatory factor
MLLPLLSDEWLVERLENGIRVTLNQQELDSKTIWILVDELFELVLKTGQTNLYVDFGNVRRLASIVFGKLITLDKKLRAMDCRLILCNVDPFVYQSFRAARLTENLDIRRDEALEAGWPSEFA